MSDLKGFKDLSKKLSDLEKKAGEKIVRRGAAKMGQVVRKEIRANAPRKTGKLHKQIKYTNKRVRTGGYLVKVGAFNDAFYAKFLEGGAKPHVIPGKRSRKRPSIGGRPFTKINHPGIKATKFIEKSFKRSQSRAVSEAGKIMFKLLAQQ